MTILVSISGLTIICFDNFIAARRTYTDAVNVSSAARVAKEDAGVKGVNVRLYIDLSNKTLWLSEAAIQSDGSLAYNISTAFIQQYFDNNTIIKEFVTPRSSSTIGSSVPTGISNASTNQDYVTYYPDGSSESAYLYLTDKSGSVYTLYFAQTTGAVKLYPYEITF
jgi:hypothetical protein